MLNALKRPTPTSAYVLLTLTMLFWAGNYTIGRWASGHVPPVTLAFLRWTGAALLILPLAWRQVEREWSLIKAHAPLILTLGILGSGLFNTLQYIALTGTTATSAGIINSATPVMIAAMSFVLNGERVRAVQIAGIATSLLGVVMVLAKGDLSTLATLEFNHGDLVMLAAIVLWALYTTLLDKRPPMTGLALAAVTYAIAALINLPLSLIELSSGATIDWSARSAAAVAYTAVFPSFLAYLFFNRGVEIIGPTRGGAFMHLVPLFTMVLAMIFLGETPSLYHAAGLILIITGVSLAARR